MEARMPGSTKISTQVGIRLPNEMHAELAFIAKVERRSLGWVAKDLIAEGLPKRLAQAKRRRVNPAE
jgi:predicted transcriptional regulator